MRHFTKRHKWTWPLWVQTTALRALSPPELMSSRCWVAVGSVSSPRGLHKGWSANGNYLLTHLKSCFSPKDLPIYVFQLKMNNPPGLLCFQCFLWIGRCSLGYLMLPTLFLVNQTHIPPGASIMDHSCRICAANSSTYFSLLFLAERVT